MRQLVEKRARLWSTGRGLGILGILFFGAVPLTISVAAVALFQGRERGRLRLYSGAVRLIQRLGPTFVKFGQIMSCRRDVLPQGFCDALAVLHDAVDPMTDADTRCALSAAYPDAAIDFDLQLLASGSIASVFRASFQDRYVALKLKRIDIEQRMIADLALMEGLVRVAERLPKCRGMPVGDLMHYVSVAILGQLDFEQEAANLTKVRDSLSAVPGVRVPAPIMEASGPGCLAMEFIPGLDASILETLPAATRHQLGETALTVAYQLMFVSGITHCDLHPGNLYATVAGELVVLDAGFCVQLPDRVRQLIGEFFYCLCARKGRRCAEIMIESAAKVGPDVDLEGFRDAVDELVRAQGVATVFSMMAFGNQIFDLQQKFGLYAQSEFAFPMMSLAVLEGTVRKLSPDVDFQQLGQTARREVARPLHQGI
jgi:ubiquinone biosynthesis protein